MITTKLRSEIAPSRGVRVHAESLSHFLKERACVRQLLLIVETDSLKKKKKIRDLCQTEVRSEPYFSHFFASGIANLPTIVRQFSSYLMSLDPCSLTLPPMTSSISFCSFLWTSGWFTTSSKHKRMVLTVVSKPTRKKILFNVWKSWTNKNKQQQTSSPEGRSRCKQLFWVEVS